MNREFHWVCQAVPIILEKFYNIKHNDILHESEITAGW